MPNFRKSFIPVVTISLVSLSTVATAQDETEQSDGSTSIDILASMEDLYGPEPPMEDCSDEQEAAILSGEIIVCRRKQDQREFRTLPDDAAESRYARETMNKDNPQTPDVAGPGIFKGKPTIGGMCIPGLQKCPPPPALIIDVSALPKAPPGSDADRISRGLPPLGDDTRAVEEEIEENELGLPPLSDPRKTTSRAEEAGPGAQQ